MAPSGTEVIATKVTARLRNANGIRADLLGTNGSTYTDLDGGVTHDGSEQVSVWSDPARPQTSVRARLSCERLDCENRPTSPRAYMEVTDAEFTVRDTRPPSVAASGQLWDWGADLRFHRASAPVTLHASDQGSGVAAAWAEVNGLRVGFAAPACPGDKGTYSTRFSPCPLTYSASRTLNTAAAPFQEGVNQLRLCARDYAASEASASVACTPTRFVLVDNQPPGPPVGLRPEGGTGWQPENGFTASWQIPAHQIAPVDRAAWVLDEQETGTRVDGGLVEGEGVESLGPVEVPGPGAYLLSVLLLDSAGNLGPAAETVLRFDDQPPGDVSPEPPSGWVSRDELPLEQPIEKAEPGGPSGISGYALAVSGDGPAPPCETLICLAPEITLAGGAEERTGTITGLAEGDHWVSAAAVSGARRASLEPGVTMLRVDRTPPSVSISGAPTGWVSQPVTLTVQASDELSGMHPLPGDDGRPRTVIEADGHAAYESPGPLATFTVATEGVNRVRYWAEDLAGNANDGRRGPNGDMHAGPGQAVVRIDATGPELGFDPVLDPADPELVTLYTRDADSGVASARIELRPAGSGDGFEPLRTHGDGDRFEARIPSDDLPRGTYELRATVTDRAGNAASGNTTLNGEPMLVHLPLKRRATLTASLGKGRKMMRARYGTRPVVGGRLTSGGTALPNQKLSVTETFVAGSRRNSVVRETTTDGDGRYRVRLTKGPSRSVAVAFDGTRTLSRASAPGLRLGTRGAVRFSLRPGKLRNGGAVRMRGTVGFRGALPPARGKLVAIQYLDPERRQWRPADLVRTNRRGGFRFLYRFRTISSAQRIVFRAQALPEAGWPYLPSTSKPRSVIVYPRN